MISFCILEWGKDNLCMVFNLFFFLAFQSMIIVLKKLKELEKQYEEQEMKKMVDFTVCKINPAPHQLVERSNLLQVPLSPLLPLHK